MEELLKVDNLSVVYHSNNGDVQAVRQISFNVKLGRTIAIVGESGCGKSATAKALMKLNDNGHGEIKGHSKIIYKGKDILKYSDEEMATYRGGEVAMIFQDALTALNPTMRIGKQIAENIILHKKDISKKQAMQEAVKLLEYVGIPDPVKRARQYPHEFSGGMRQRVMIAIAIACRPRILIADEPTTALDVTIQAQIIKLLKELQNSLNMSIILITHDLGVVADIAHDIAVMYGGEIVEMGTCDEIFYEPRHPYTKALLNSVTRIDEKKKRLVTIEGMPPNLIDDIKGCAFYDRCTYSMEKCRNFKPQKTIVSDTHNFTCFRDMNIDKERKGLDGR